MNMNLFNLLVPVLIGISLMSERIVTVVKTAFPWLTEEKKTEAKEVDLVADRWRRLIVQALAFVASWLVAGMLQEDGNLLGSFVIGSGAEARSIPVWLVGLLASGGSAFWNNVLGYSKGLKDNQRLLNAAGGLDYTERARAAGVVVHDTGATARAQAGGRGGPAVQEAERRIAALDQPQLDSTPNRIAR
ncbi:MAG TPA: hypothetical protein VF615_21510 [Longimicrobiaceae bacterium]|jgi:hypothetical protein